jgi:hypothetical protein
LRYVADHPDSGWHVTLFVTNWAFLVQTLNAMMRVAVVAEAIVHEKLRGEGWGGGGGEEEE